ncbi:MAG: nucleotidyltransferase family protein [Campylobacterota bacterium]|nr:nucleotidyltransferase family protein [Campylobacterota bacterium]
MSSLDQLKREITAMKPYLMQNYNVGSLYIFGSYAREEQTDSSDVDLLVDFKKSPDLLTFIELEEYLSTQLNHSVDLVPRRKLKAQLKAHILKEAIAV